MICYLRKSGRVYVAILPKKIADALYYGGRIDEWQRIYFRRGNRYETNKEPEKAFLHHAKRQICRRDMGRITGKSQDKLLVEERKRRR